MSESKSESESENVYSTMSSMMCTTLCSRTRSTNRRTMRSMMCCAHWYVLAGGRCFVDAVVSWNLWGQMPSLPHDGV